MKMMCNSISLLLFSLLLHSLSIESHFQGDLGKLAQMFAISAKSGDQGDLGKGLITPTVPYELDYDIRIDGKRPSLKLAPALYVFGDSGVDVGNNNYLPTVAKANFLPYGVDFLGIPTGRFTNGKTGADFFGRLLGLPFPPPYLGLLESQRKNITTGTNYGSGACGILPKTGNITGHCLNLDTQIDLFNSTITNDLPKQFSLPKDLSDHLAKSIFYVSIGSNDFFLNYLNPQVPDYKNYTHETFSKFLADELSKRLKRLYQLGARKFVVSDFGPAGCSPGAVNTVKPKTPCVEDLNQLMSLYNAHFSPMIKNLRSTLQGSIFVHQDCFKTSALFEKDRLKYGIMDMKHPCCLDIGRNETMPCEPNLKSCNNSNHRAYFDAGHPSQISNKLITELCFYKPSVCHPMSVKQLAKA